MTDSRIDAGAERLAEITGRYDERDSHEQLARAVVAAADRTQPEPQGGGMTQLTNPKDLLAQATGKPRLDLLEPVANEGIARALAFGADKYGIRNYVESPIAARVYVAAIMRHCAAFLRGEDIADDSGCHHLDHVGANVHVVKGAIEAGTFIDDRHGKAGQDSSAKPAVVITNHHEPVHPSALQVAIRGLRHDQ